VPLITRLMCAVLAVSIAAAQDGSRPTPALIRFSGQTSATAAVALTFALYSERDGGTALWQETQNVLPDASGHYNVLLGAATEGGVPAGVFASTDARWLNVLVNGKEEGARVMLVSVPYAMKAADATTLAGHPANEFVTHSELHAMMKQFSAPALSAVRSSATPQVMSAITPVPEASSGTAGFIGKFTNTTDLGNSLLFDNGTSVGLGTTTPDLAHQGQKTLTIFDSTKAAAFEFGSATTTNTAQLGTFTWLDTSSSSADPRVAFFDALVDTTNASYGGRLRFGTKTAGGSLLSRMNIMSNGRIGINTSAPTQILDVNGNINSSGTVSALAYTGSGSGLTSVPASALTGTIPAGVIGGTYSGAVNFSNGANSFTGSGAGLTNIPASALTGTLATGSLSGTYSGALTLSNASNSFAGSGTGLTSLNATNLSSGTIADARLSTNVAFLSAANAFAADQSIAGNLFLSKANSGNVGPVLTLTNSATEVAGAGGAIDFNGYNNISGSATVRVQSVDDGNFSSDLRWMTKVPGSQFNSPAERMRLSSVGNLVLDPGGTNGGNLTPGLLFGSLTSGEAIGSKRSATGNQFGLDFYTGGVTHMSLTHAGALGIGTTSPGDALEVKGTDATVRVRNSTDSIGAFFGNTATSAQFGFFNTGNSAANGIAAHTKQSFFGISADGEAGSLTNIFGTPAYRNLLDDGAGNASISGNLSANNLPGVSSLQGTGETNVHACGTSWDQDTVTLAVPASGYLVIQAFEHFSTSSADAVVGFSVVNVTGAATLVNVNPSAAIVGDQVWNIPWTLAVSAGSITLKTAGSLACTTGSINVIDHSLVVQYMPKSY
jgi:hypothetical protein